MIKYPYLQLGVVIVFISTSIGLKCNSGSNALIQHCSTTSRGFTLTKLPPILLSATTIFLNNSSIRDADLREFNVLSSVHNLYLHDNNITKISAEWFVKFHSLLSIDLSGNAIKDVGPKVFRNCPKLQYLNLSNNRIRRFHDTSDDFRNVHIDLSFNPLVDLKIGSVHTLYLHHTHLEELHLKKSVVNLHAGHSRIRNFSVEVENSDGLEVLDLRANNLTDIGNITALRGGPKYLDLSQNYFGSLYPNALLNLHRLHHLNLSQTVILNLFYGMFWNQKHLKVLDLSYNHLWNFNTKKLYPAMLHELYIQKNGISKIIDERDTLHNLKKFGLAGNSLNCEDLFGLYINATMNGVEIYTPTNLIEFETNNIAGMACEEPN